MDLLVLVQRGTSAEAAEAREVFGPKIAVGTVWGHTPGQRLNNDVVVIGSGAGTVERDALGKVTRYSSLAEARSRRSSQDAAPRGPAPAEPPTPGPAESLEDKTVPELKAEAKEMGVELPSRALKADIVEALEEAADPLKGRSRVEAIQYAARRWPGARRWATLTDPDLGAAIDELEAGD